MNPPKSVPLIECPLSQTCMDCLPGQFVEIEDKPSCYLCHWDRSDDVLTITQDCPQSIPLVFEGRLLCPV